MILSVLIAVFSVIILLLVVGYVFMRRSTHAPAFQIGAYILLLLLGLWVVGEGLYLPTGEKIIQHNVTVGEDVVTIETQSTETYASVNTSLGLTLIVLSMLGMFTGIQRFDEDDSDLF